jgi:hypothetical protein
MTREELKAAKSAFLNRYNSACCNSDLPLQQAALDALMSASQHNSLYAKSVSERERGCVREYWKTLLGTLAHKYESRVSTSQCEADIQELRQTMNEHFADRFRSDRHPKYKYDPGFRISHAQKSLSVFLKHLWCRDMIETPPQCPVDSIILEKAGLRYPVTRWAYVNSIDEHRRKIARLAQCAMACGLELAEWELLKFEERESQ